MTETVIPNQAPWESIRQGGLHFLLEQWQQGFAEAAHEMFFPQAQGFIAAQEMQYGDIFQRALIADVLCDAKEYSDEHLQSILKPMIEREVDYLLSRQHQSNVGGWSYFPDLPELPPDADDLAQVMQVLLRSGHYLEVKQYCEDPLSVLLQDNPHTDGSFETWIVPATDRTPEQQLQALWIQQAWGTGPDPDVMANLLYALALYDLERFAPAIQQGVTYLESQQSQNGHWHSSWYNGPYYGTYVCLRLLAFVCPDSPGVDQAKQFLLANQRTDGGWGIEAVSDPLSTALALLSLAVIPAVTGAATELDSLLQAQTYLEQCREPDSSWPSCRFIRMELGRATGRVRAILFYGSRTITTAFVLKAALAWQELARNYALP